MMYLPFTTLPPRTTSFFISSSFLLFYLFSDSLVLVLFYFVFSLIILFSLHADVLILLPSYSLFYYFLLNKCIPSSSFPSSPFLLFFVFRVPFLLQHFFLFSLIIIACDQNQCGVSVIGVRCQFYYILIKTRRNDCFQPKTTDDNDNNDATIGSYPYVNLNYYYSYYYYAD